MMGMNLAYKRGIFGMGGNKKAKFEIEEISKRVEKLEENANKKRTIKDVFLEHPITSVFATALLALLGWTALTMWNLNADMREVMVRLNNIDNKMNKFGDSIDVTDTEIQELKEKYALLNDNIQNLAGDFSEVFEIKLKENDESIVGVSYEGTFTLEMPTWNSSDIIATDINDGKAYTAMELANKKLLVPYKEKNLDVIFYGQYNENNRWDGKCLLNVYSGDILVAINESIYNDGKLLSYKQVMSDTINGKDAWVVAEKEVIDVEKDVRNGDSCSYYKTSDYEKNFECNDIDISYLLYIDYFKENINKQLLKFYHGNTSEGYYNDDTGEAYLVEFFDDETVKTLYKGEFKDGKFNDETGNAWYITKDENTDYMYYVGRFKDNEAIDATTKDNFINPLSLEQIYNIIHGMTFDCKLKWYGLSDEEEF